MKLPRPFVRVTLVCALLAGLLAIGGPGIALADDGEPVSRTARANLSELALSPDGGRAYLVWSDFLDAQGRGLGEIYFRFRDGGGWHPALDQPPVNISRSPEVHSEQPTIAVDTAGGVQIAWGEGRPRKLLGRYLAPGADPANPDSWRAEVISTEEDVQNANLAPDPAGGAWIVYTAIAGGTYNILARHRGGGGWEGSENVSRSGGFVGKVAVDRAGVVSVAWWSQNSIRYAARTGGWTAPETVASPATQQTGIVAEPGGRVHLVYTDASGTGADDDRRIAYRTRESATAPWSAPQVISETANALEPRIAWADGRLVAAWNERSGGPARIMVAQNFGGGWRDRRAFTSGFRAFSPWIVQGGNAVAYLSFRNAETDQIYFATYSSGLPAPSPAPSPAPPANNPAQRAAPVAGASFFEETGHNLGGAFRAYWLANGGLARFGYPLTEEFTERSADDGRDYTVQYFERARFEYHPDNPDPYKVLLGLLGRRLRAPDPPAEVIPGASYFAETGHNLGGTFRAYWLANGGLATFGLPLSEAFTETSPTDGKQYIVQYFERNRFELHPENAAPYDVLLGLLGRQELVARGWLPK